MMSTQNGQHEQFEEKLRAKHKENERLERLEIQIQLRSARRLCEQLQRKLIEEDEYCHSLVKRLGAMTCKHIFELPRDVLQLLLDPLEPIHILALSKTCHKFHRFLHHRLMKTLRRMYKMKDSTRVDLLAPLNEARYVSYSIRPLVVPSTSMVSQRELYCLRCRKLDHEIPQCSWPCRKCNQCGHPESQCRKKVGFSVSMNL